MKSIVLSSAVAGVVLGLAGAFAATRQAVPVAVRALPPAVVVPLVIAAPHGGTPERLGNEMPTKTGFYPADGGGAPELFGGVGTDINGNRVATPRPTARAGGSGVSFP